MKKNARMAWLICLFFLLTGCSQAATSKIQLTLTPTHPQETSKTPRPTRTHNPTRTSGPTSDIQPTETPTPTPTPKTSLIELSQGAGDGVDEMTICMAVYSPYPRFILYEDGQLIFYKENKYQETHLSKEQIDDLMQKIEATGYFHIGDTFKEQYDLPQGIEIGGGGWDVLLSVNGKNVDIDPMLEKYLLKPVKDTVEIVESYQPDGDIKNYIPNSINLSAFEANNGAFPTPAPSQKIAAWPTGLFTLKPTYRNLSKSEMETFAKLHLFTSVPQLRLFEQDGVVYYVLGCPPWDGW